MSAGAGQAEARVDPRLAPEAEPPQAQRPDDDVRDAHDHGPGVRVRRGRSRRSLEVSGSDLGRRIGNGIGRRAPGSASLAPVAREGGSVGTGRLDAVDRPDERRRRHEHDDQGLDHGDDVDRCRRCSPASAPRPAWQPTEQQGGEQHADRVAAARAARRRWRRSRCCRPRRRSAWSEMPSTFPAPARPARPPATPMVTDDQQAGAHAGVAGGVGVEPERLHLEAPGRPSQDPPHDDTRRRARAGSRR